MATVSTFTYLTLDISDGTRLGNHVERLHLGRWIMLEKWAR
jgi:hypothetical protein